MTASANLPAFMRFNAPKSARHITSTHAGFTVEGETSSFPTMSAAYDHIHDILGEEAVFTTGEDDGFFIEEGTNRMLMSYDPVADRARAVEEYSEFLDIVAAYRQDPDDFYNAYQFVNSHPVFWYHVNMRDGDIAWDYNGYVNGQNALDVYRDDETNEIRFLIEPVIYEGNRRTSGQQVLDTNLVVIEDSFNGAIIALAARIDAYYDETGDARQDVANTPYTQHLADRIAASQR